MSELHLEDINTQLSMVASEELLEEVEPMFFEDYKEAVAIEDGKLQGKKNKFKMFAESDIRPVPTIIINRGYIPFVQNSYNIIAGAGGVGKSGVALKSGVIYLLDNPNKKVFFWFSEDGIDDVKNRLRIICNNMSANYDELLSRMLFQTRETDNVSEKFVARGKGRIEINKEIVGELAEQCILNNVGFVVLDPLRRFHNVDENSNSEMPSLTTDVFKVFPLLSNTTLVVLHHSSKEGAIRGASAITDDTRASWKLSKAKIKDKETGEVSDDPDFKGMIKLQMYKENGQVERYCSIRDDKNMIPNPMEQTNSYGAVETHTYQDNNVDTSRGYPVITENSEYKYKADKDFMEMFAKMKSININISSLMESDINDTYFYYISIIAEQEKNFFINTDIAYDKTLEFANSLVLKEDKPGIDLPLI